MRRRPPCHDHQPTPLTWCYKLEVSILKPCNRNVTDYTICAAQPYRVAKALQSRNRQSSTSATALFQGQDSMHDHAHHLVAPPLFPYGLVTGLVQGLRPPPTHTHIHFARAAASFRQTAVAVIRGRWARL